MGQTRYAVLDTDFVSKANIIKSGNRVLADEVLEFQGYICFANGAQIPCISILSVFFKMWKLGKDFEAVEPFFQSFVEWCSNRKNPQMFVKVWKFKNGSDKRERVTITSVLTDIYSGVYGVRKNGDLQMIREIS